MNKRKRTAVKKHRKKQRKMKEKQKAIANKKEVSKGE